MPAPTTGNDLLELVRKSGVVEEKRLQSYILKLRAPGAAPSEPSKLAGLMVRDGIITQFQAEQFLQGKWRRFTLGRYKVLEKIGQGGMGTVFLCEHRIMRRRTAVKVLPNAKAADPASLERFQREARAVAALDHPNIVRAYDIDQDGELHFLVMEYVDGSSLQEIVKKHGPMDVLRACHYMRQAAAGLQHAHQVAGLVHRDIKPSNLLVDRNGIVKILDMGLARFFHDEEDILTKKYDEAVLGTADYLAPEQALDSHNVDIRADIYSLGATFYFLLTGSAPFKEGSVAQKLLWHQTRAPKPIRAVRPEVPEKLTAIVERMMAKEPGQRYQTPAELVDALAAWTARAIGPPPEREMPRLCPAAQTAGVMGEGVGGPVAPYPTTAVSTRPLSSPTNGTRTPAPKSVPPVAPPLAVPVSDPTPPPPPTAPPLALATPQAPEADQDSLVFQSLPVVRPRVPRSPSLPRLPLDRRTRRIIAIAAGIVILVVVLILVIWAWPRRPGASSPRPPAAARTLIVCQGGQDGAFQSLQDAVDDARPHDSILVRDERITGSVHVDKRDITIEPDPPGRSVLWRCVQKPLDGTLLSLTGAANFHLKGFTLEGGRQVADLVTISGPCPGLTLDDLQLQGFTRAAVALSQASGKLGDNLQLVNLRIANAPGKATETGLRFVGDSDQEVCAYISVERSRFEGPLESAIQVAGSIQHVDVRDCQISKVDTGLRYEFHVPRHGIDLQWNGNNVSDVKTAFLFFGGWPLGASDRSVVLRRNMFTRVGSLLQIERDKPTQEDIKKLFAGSADNKRDSATKPYPVIPTTLSTQR